jgi:hypothetical protein
VYDMKLEAAEKQTKKQKTQERSRNSPTLELRLLERSPLILLRIQVQPPRGTVGRVHCAPEMLHKERTSSFRLCLYKKE